MNFREPLPLLLIAITAAAISATLIFLLRPLLQRYALARPNARSSHRLPTPQGAGIAVIAATLSVAGAYAASIHIPIPANVFGATLFIALVGAIDDIRSIPVLPRLLLQAAAVGTIAFTASPDLRIAPPFPLLVETTLVLLSGLWFVNLVNFMDGLDCMTVAEVVPATGAIVIFGLLGGLSGPSIIMAAALCGAMLGFAPFNRPIAKVFLGDVGSLSIGLLLGWCLLELVYQHHFAAAFLLPLYYLADATVTLLRRIVRNEPFWAAHRSHYYQRATDNGFTVVQVVSRVFALNLLLAALALTSLVFDTGATTIACLVVGTLAVVLLMWRFSKPR